MLKSINKRRKIEDNQKNLVCLPCEYSGGENNYVHNQQLEKHKKGLGWIQDYANKYLNINQ